jgi:tRNA(Ile)-lysidine synthetase-like protein
MDIDLPPGFYVMAVSGGVDSMVLLDLLSREKIGLVVAHFNHGIRADSERDEALVKAVVKQYELPLEVGYGNLGHKASEEKARQARYEFLNDTAKKYGAKQIITAHHQDDLIETALINLLRGTGRKGLTAILDNPNILRPLINYPKLKIIKYAKDHKIAWNEDSTNQDLKYLRNYIRLQIMPNITAPQRETLLKQISKLSQKNKETDKLLGNLSKKVKAGDLINRQGFISLPMEIAKELMVFWLREQKIDDFDKKIVERLVIALKTAKPGTRHSITKDKWLEVSVQTARIV